MKIEFISYTGRYPNLCRGIVTLRIDGETRELDKHCLSSSGGVWFDEDWHDHVDEGPWEVCRLPEDLAQYHKEITDLINENVDWGCCGGCI